VDAKFEHGLALIRQGLAILYRKGTSGQRPRDTDAIRLTKEGERLAREYRRLQGQAA
jgi:hypothetical protein